MRRFLLVCITILLFGGTVQADLIAGQDFNDLSAASNCTTDSLANGTQLTNAGANNIGGAGLDFQTFWYDTRGEASGPVTETNDTSDYIGVNAYTGTSSPDVASDGTAVESGIEHNFEFSDGDGRLDLVFETVDVSGYTDRVLSLDYWINDTGYESDDAFYVTISDGSVFATFLNFGETGLESSASVDDGTANWNSFSLDLEDLISTYAFGESLSLTISVDTNAATENIFVDNVAFTANPVPVPAAVWLLGSGLLGLLGIRRKNRQDR
jgi:hypothetical protein